MRLSSSSLCSLAWWLISGKGWHPLLDSYAQVAIIVVDGDECRHTCMQLCATRLMPDKAWKHGSWQLVDFVYTLSCVGGGVSWGH